MHCHWAKASQGYEVRYPGAGAGCCKGTLWLADKPFRTYSMRALRGCTAGILSLYNIDSTVVSIYFNAMKWGFEACDPASLLQRELFTSA